MIDAVAKRSGVGGSEFGVQFHARRRDSRSYGRSAAKSRVRLSNSRTVSAAAWAGAKAGVGDAGDDLGHVVVHLARLAPHGRRRRGDVGREGVVQ